MVELFEKHWDLVLTIVLIVVAWARQEMKVRHNAEAIEEINDRHKLCRESLDKKRDEMLRDLSEIKVTVGRIDQRIDDFLNGDRKRPKG